MDEAAEKAPATRPSPRTNTTPTPKGILKNTNGPQESRSPHLTWDEPNLALNDLNRDSTMKITEPKTPFVRYNPETDEVMDLESIPDFDLGHASTSSSHSLSAFDDEPAKMHEDKSTAYIPSGFRRSSSSSSRRGSGSTERRQVLVQPPVGSSSTAGDHALNDDDDDANLDPDTKAKHDAFVRARKGHYGNEAEAMKKARRLAEKEEIESEATVESDQLSDTSNSDIGPVVANGV